MNRRHVDCLNFERDYNYFLNRISQFTGRDVHSTATFEKFSRPLKIGSRLKIGQGGKSLLLTLRGKTGEYFTFDMSHNPVYLQSNHRFREYEGEWDSAETYFSQIEKYVKKKAEKQSVTPYLLNTEDSYELYRVLTDKLKHGPLSILSITQTVINNLEKVEEKIKIASLDQQAYFLSNLMQWITQAKLIRFKDFNGTEKVGLRRLSVKLSTLHKFDYLQIVDSSLAGNFISYSPNLLKLADR